MTRRSTVVQPGRVPLAALLLVALAATATLVASTAKDLYTAALTDERQLRAPADEPPTLTQLRDAIAAYTEVVRRHPRSGYSDNALWQAAGLAIQAFDRYRQPADRAAGVRFLRTLQREYPSSSLVPRVADRLDQLRRLDEPVQIRAIHREPLADIVRVTIELDDEVRYHTERLDGPARLFFDFSGTYAAPPLRDATLAFDDGDMVREIRLGRHLRQTTRVVLDIEDVDHYSVYSLYNPYRLVVDTVPTASMQTRRATPDATTHGAVVGDRKPLPADPVDDPAAVERATSGVEPDAAPAALVSDGGARQLDAPPAAASAPGEPVDPHVTDVSPPRPNVADLLPVPEGWEARRLDPIPPALEPVTADLVNTEPSVSTPEAVTNPEPAAATPVFPVSTVGVLPLPRVDQTVQIVRASPAPTEWFSETPIPTPDAVAPATLVVPVSMAAVLPFPRADPTVQIAQQAPAPVDAPVAEGAVASFGFAEAQPRTGTAVANSDGDFSLGRQLGLGVSRIVIDPGHGGYDPGARTGALTESALVLDVARRLEARLATETGIEVILTRRRDAYMPLRARTELANRVGADLFLSIHANAAKDQRTRGVETYYLDLATEPDAQIVAARENAASREGMHDLPNLVRSITMHNKLHESRDFAGMVQRNMIRAVRELHPGAQDLGVKQAPFVVLIGANMPSVLAEISFLTNREDAAFLATDAYRERIADALLQSIIEYQRTLKPSTSFTAENNE